jgi:N-acetylglucosamine kinase-like BadF-type ATPase
MALFLALDGGGTKTRCWIADETRVLGEATGGTVKIMNVGETIATGRLQELVRIAARDADVSLQGVVRTCMGLAGISSATVRSWAEATLGAMVAGEIVLCGDEEIALDAAFHGGPGVLVVAGTGSNVVGRCSSGKLLGAGGWGPVIGDEGSGTWIGLEAIRAGLRAHDRGIETCMLAEIKRFWGMDDDDQGLDELVAKANQRPRPDFAELTMVVAQCADQGDSLAISVLERAGEHLAAQVQLVISKMHAAGCTPEDAGRVAFTGSVLEKLAPVRRAMEGYLRVMVDGLELVGSVDPMEGALWRARRPVARG